MKTRGPWPGLGAHGLPAGLARVGLAKGLPNQTLAGPGWGLGPPRRGLGRNRPPGWLAGRSWESAG